MTSPTHGHGSSARVQASCRIRASATALCTYYFLPGAATTNGRNPPWQSQALSWSHQCCFSVTIPGSHSRGTISSARFRRDCWKTGLGRGCLLFVSRHPNLHVCSVLFARPTNGLAGRQRVFRRSPKAPFQRHHASGALPGAPFQRRVSSGAFLAAPLQRSLSSGALPAAP